MLPECDKNKKVAHEAIAECVTDVLLSHVFSDLVTEQTSTATWNLVMLFYNNDFIIYSTSLVIKKQTNVYLNDSSICIDLFSSISYLGKNQSKCNKNLSYYNNQ